MLGSRTWTWTWRRAGAAVGLSSLMVLGTTAGPGSIARLLPARAACMELSDVSASPFDLPGDDGVAPEGTIELDPVDLGSGTRAPAVTTATQIDVWFHVIQPADPLSSAESNAILSAGLDARLARQMETLNASFAGETGGATSPFGFVHAGTDRTANDAWYGTEFDHGSPGEIAAKQALRKGDAKTLNVYVTDTATGALQVRPDLRRHRRRRRPAPRRRPAERQLPGRHRRPRDGALARALPHVPGGLHDR
jgi:hypothetical protein